MSTAAPIPRSVSGPFIGSGGLCLDNFNEKFRNGNPVDVWTCNGRLGQKIALVDGGPMEILEMCLHIRYHELVMWDCQGIAEERWNIGADGSLMNQGTHECLEYPSGAEPGALPIMRPCTSALNQQWALPTESA